MTGSQKAAPSKDQPKGTLVPHEGRKDLRTYLLEPTIRRIRQRLNRFIWPDHQRDQFGVLFRGLFEVHEFLKREHFDLPLLIDIDQGILILRPLLLPLPVDSVRVLTTLLHASIFSHLFGLPVVIFRSRQKFINFAMVVPLGVVHRSLLVLIGREDVGTVLNQHPAHLQVAL